MAKQIVNHEIYGKDARLRPDGRVVIDRDKGLHQTEIRISFSLVELLDSINQSNGTQLRTIMAKWLEANPL